MVIVIIIVGGGIWVVEIRHFEVWSGVAVMRVRVLLAVMRVGMARA
jgi:hypothetical protein